MITTSHARARTALQKLPYSPDPVLAAALGAKAREGMRGSAAGRVVARGEGWRVLDVVCTSGPADPMFEERFGHVSVSLVLAGSFAWRSSTGASFLTPGSVLLGDADVCFECGHLHGEGDRCLSFQFDPGLFDQARAATGGAARFHGPRAETSPASALLFARAISGLQGRRIDWEALAFEVGASAAGMGAGRGAAGSAADQGRVAEAVRRLERNLDAPGSLGTQAAALGLSAFHYLRLFRRVTGVTPHQHLLRARLREAARRLAATRAPVTEIALDVGFQDLANFNRNFRREFGMTPTRWRAEA